MNVCFAGGTWSDNGGMDDFAYSLTGTLSAVVPDATAMAKCTESALHWPHVGWTYGGSLAEAAWFTVESDSVMWTLGISAPPFTSLATAPGTAVTVEWVGMGDGGDGANFHPGEGSFTVSDTNGAALLLSEWYYTNGVAPSGFTAIDGETVCTESCYDGYEGEDMITRSRVVTGSSRNTVSLVPGDTALLDGYSITLAANRHLRTETDSGFTERVILYSRLPQ